MHCLKGKKAILDYSNTNNNSSNEDVRIGNTDHRLEFTANHLKSEKSFDNSNSLKAFDCLPDQPDEFYQLERFKKHSYDNLTNEESQEDLIRFKLIELELNRLVLDSSRLAMNEKDFRLALAKARESMELLKKLKLLMNQVELIKQPMTTGVGLFELNLMVLSNFANQLTNSKLFKESIEQYSKLIKMSSNDANADAYDELESFNFNFKRQTFSNRFERKILFERFGLNLGNNYFLLNDFTKALKYYRLTLDRLNSSLISEPSASASASASSFSLIQLKLKLMQNISLTLIENYLFIKQKPNSRSILNEAKTSIKLFLADNTDKKSRSTNKSFQESKRVAEQIIEQKSPPVAGFLAATDLIDDKANHHQLQASCLNKNHHKFALNLIICLSQVETQGEKRIEDSLKLVIDTIETQLLGVDICHQFGRVFNLKRLKFKEATGRSTIGQPQQASQTSGSGQLATYANRNGTSLVVNESRAVDFTDQFNESLHQLVASIEQDKLELLIEKSYSNYKRSLLFSYNLLLKLRLKFQDELNDDDDDDDDDVYEHDLGDSLARLVKCLNRLLIEELSINEALNLLNENKLNRSVESLKKVLIERRQASNLTASLIHYWQANSVQNAESSLLNEANCKEFDDLVNLANCHYFLGNFLKAKKVLEKINYSTTTTTTTTAPATDNWLIQYNLAILSKKLNFNIDDKCYSILSSKSNKKKKLPLLQLVSTLNQLGEGEKSLQILNNLVEENSKQSAEFYLLLSKLLIQNSESRSKDLNSLVRAKTLLLQAKKLHPHHLTLLERLIALSINEFDFLAAKELLLECIKNRPDQVKWYQMLAECHRQSADYAKAIETYKLAIDLFPLNCAFCLKSLLKLYEELGFSEEDKNYYKLKLEKLKEFESSSN